MSKPPVYRIRTVAVLGAGTMGASIACHLAGVGLKVWLFDVASDGNDPNALVNKSLEACLNSKPNPIYLSEFRNRIHLVNFRDHWNILAECDWILEAVKEDLDIKRKMFERMETVIRSGTIVSSNSSSIPMHQLVEGRSMDFQKHFIGTHFFNPPRYLPLLEIIPHKETLPELVECMLHFGQVVLGKQTVRCKDTPGFIANRLGIPVLLFQTLVAKKYQLDVFVADRMTGVAMGRPKTGTFQLADWVGLDVAYHAWKVLKATCPNDRLLQNIQEPEEWMQLIKENKLGKKTAQGFYRKLAERSEDGKSVIQGLQWGSLEYQVDSKSHFESIELSKRIEDLTHRLKLLVDEKDGAARLARESIAFLLAYTASLVPEICNTIWEIDLSLRASFGWQMGPFQYWDALGFEESIQLLNDEGYKCPKWISEMRDKGYHCFYHNDDTEATVYDPLNGNYSILPGASAEMGFNVLGKSKIVYQNEELILHDLGQNILCAGFTSRNNVIGGGILNGLQHSIRLAEAEGWDGLVIGNHSKNFTVGADLLQIGMMAFQQDWQQLDIAVRLFQETSMLCRYSAVPIVLACQGYTFGGGVELLMHCDGAVVAAESYIGLVEAGVGLLPGGGGTKEFARRLSLELKPGEVHIPQLLQRFKTLATASVSTSAHEAFELGYLDHSRDRIDYSGLTNVRKAKQLTIQLSERYLPPLEQKIYILGRTGMASLYLAAHSMLKGGFASDHDLKIAQKMAYVMCGGDLSYPQMVSEQYLLDLEREAFLSLCSEPKTLERIQYMLEHRKPLRN